MTLISHGVPGCCSTMKTKMNMSGDASVSHGSVPRPVKTANGHYGNKV